ncbi:unnamed protein product [Ostreobium quekettii]|uniref:Uncharacterized protein n=1 Tax=Ostreobium quekettii TaxID=121088 RepID=A0A8S1IU69_9CHLO|nr:unnamed protein product [Ostreobium quekettii]
MGRMRRFAVLCAVALSALCWGGATATRVGWEGREENSPGMKLRDLRLLMDSPNTADEQALIMAATDGDFEEVERLLNEGVDIEVRTARDSTPLMLAAFMGHLEIVELLIDEGARINSTDIDERTPLHYASQKNHTTVVQVLLEHGADLNSQGTKMSTPLFVAAQSDATGALDYLLQMDGIEVDLDNFQGWTPLIAAADMGHEASVQRLLDAEADPTVATNLRATALHRAALTLEGNRVLPLLIDRGVEVNALDNANDTPLEYATWAGNTPAVQILLNAGANTSIPNRNGNLPADALCLCLASQRCATPCDTITNNTIMALLDGEMPELRSPTPFSPTDPEETPEIPPFGVRRESPQAVAAGEEMEGAGTALSPLWATVCLSLVVGLVSLLELC